MKHIQLFALGGTIAMLQADGGGAAVPALDGNELIRALPALPDGIRVTGSTFRQLPSASLTFDDIVSLAERIDNLDAGIGGVVVTQGTDTIEETSFALELLVRREIPVVVTGAMRNAGLPGADGPANLLHAVLTAAADEASGMGTLVVINDEIHAARYVRKSHTQSLAAFRSAAGPVGWIVEGKPEFVRHTKAIRIAAAKDAESAAPVALLPVGFGDDGRMLQALRSLGYGGLVLEALGGGHVPAAMTDPLETAAREMPVVLASRAGAGKVLRNTYGYAGSETDLLARGLIGGGWLDGRKCRVLLQLLLRSGHTRSEIADFFRRFDRP